ncbi:MAG: MarR family winged helix-turn-helix transcriptional regulator [Pseudomonadota bacterium]|nr:MarR family winged helix-turn-helix transcriptional regulator [Pseudomonadota bacterium]MEC8531550.1 MarR family winged helix-turn-helix transcriptional regulator [Pseudomonadota bacterium]
MSEITPALNKAGVNIQSWRVLIALYQGGKQTVGDLSELTSINFSTLSRVLDRMEDKNLARRQRGADDARSFTVILTSKGKAVTEKILPYAKDLEVLATSDFTEAELNKLRELLSKLYIGLGSGNKVKERMAG